MRKPGGLNDLTLAQLRAFVASTWLGAVFYRSPDKIKFRRKNVTSQLI